MLREMSSVRQIPDEPQRRWFSDEHFDLVVWNDEQGGIIGFQLCYDRAHAERALTWKTDTGFSHNAVDDGENRPGRYKSTPILVADGAFDPQTVAAKFLGHAGALDSKSTDFIYYKLLEYPDA